MTNYCMTEYDYMCAQPVVHQTRDIWHVRQTPGARCSYTQATPKPTAARLYCCVLHATGYNVVRSAVCFSTSIIITGPDYGYTLTKALPVSMKSESENKTKTAVKRINDRLRSAPCVVNYTQAKGKAKKCPPHLTVVQ